MCWNGPRYYGICPQRRQHSSVGTMLEPPSTKNIHLMTDDKSLPWNFSSYSMSHGMSDALSASTAGREEALSKSIAKSEPNSGISWPKWWWREEMAHSNEAAGDR